MYQHENIRDCVVKISNPNPLLPEFSLSEGHRCFNSSAMMRRSDVGEPPAAVVAAAGATAALLDPFAAAPAGPAVCLKRSDEAIQGAPIADIRCGEGIMPLLVWSIRDVLDMRGGPCTSSSLLRPKLIELKELKPCLGRRQYALDNRDIIL